VSAKKIQVISYKLVSAGTVSVKFQDGEAFDANAVKFNFDRLLSKSTLGAQPGFFTVVSAMDVIDSNHIRFTLKESFAAFVHALTLGVATFIAPNSVNQSPNTSQHIAQPVGTGPYVFKEHVKGDHVTVTRNPDYWGPKPSYRDADLQGRGRGHRP